MVAIGIRFISKIGIVEVMLTVSGNSLFAKYSGSFCLICLSDKQAMIGLMQNCDPQSWPVWECNQLAGNNRQEFIQWAIQIFDQQRYETSSCALRGSKLYSVFFEVFLKDVLFECLCGRVSSSVIDQGALSFASLCFPSFFEACVRYIRHVLGRCEGQVMRQASQEKSNAQIVEEMHKKVASTVV